MKKKNSKEAANTLSPIKFLKKTFPRITAVILSILTLISSFPAFALTEGNSYSVEKTHLNAYYDTGRWETANGTVHDNWGQVSLYTLKSTGEPVYCLQIYEDFAEGVPVTAKSIDETFVWKNEYSKIAQQIVTRVSIWGFPNYNYGYSKTNAHLATKVLFWEAETGARKNYDTGCTSWAKTIFENYPDALKCYNEILKACQSHEDRPSFNNSTITLKGVGEANAVTLTDSNGLLSQFTVESSNSNIKTSVSGNNLKIWCTKSDDFSGAITLMKKNTDLDTVFALTGANQMLLYGTISDPVQARIKVNVETEHHFNVSVEKQSSLNGETLSGAAFKIQQWSKSESAYVDYKKLTETGNGKSTRYIVNNLLVTDDNGGRFKLVETKAPKGYSNKVTFTSDKDEITSSGVFKVSSDDEDEKTFEFIAENGPTEGSVALKKTADDGKVAGFKFHLYGTADIGVKVDRTGVTDSKGELNFENLYVGTYTIEEIEVPDHIIPPAKQTVRVEEGDPTPVYFNNSLYHFNISVEKQSSLNGETLSGAAFKVQQWSKAANAFVDYKTLTETKVNGKSKYIGNELFVSADNEGKFKLVETGVPNGYKNDPVFYSDNNDITADGVFTFNTKSDENNKTFYVIVKNGPETGNATVKKTSEDGKVEGFRFHLYGTSTVGIKVDEYGISDGEGKIDFKNIYVGTYTIEEVDLPPYYITPEKQTVTIVKDQTKTVSFENKLKRGDLQVVKTAEDNFKAGFRFHLTGTSLSGVKIDEYATTNDQGIAIFKNILIGSNYVIEEVDTPIRYVVPAKQTQPIEWNKVTNATFNNKLKKFNVQVTKTDSETRTPQGDAALAGAVYGIYNNGVLVDKYTTDAHGQFTTKYYICGDNWTLKEISPSSGYLLDETVHKIGAEAKLYTAEYNTTSNDVVESVIKGSLAIIKHSDDGSTQIETPEVGAEFQLYLKAAGSYAKAKESERDILICDENGYAASKELPFGRYTVHQTKGWEGRELMPDFDVFISKHGEVYRFLINNSFFESYVKIVKIDAETGKAIPYAGAGFQLYTPEGELIEHTFTYPTPTTIDTFYTNSEGWLVTPETLPFGSGYSLVEVQAPYGYVLDSTPIYFDIKQEDSTEDGILTVVVVERPNVAQKGVIEITKTGEVFSSVAESNEIYTPIFADQALSNAVYEIYAYEDIITPEGTIRAAEGELVDTVTTGEEGTGISKPLYLGKYLVKEATAPDTFVLNNEEYLVELAYAGQEVEIISTALSFYNERQKVEISLLKVLENNDRYDIGTNGEVFSVQFGIYAAEEITAADGSVIPVDGMITFANCDENSSITFDCDLPIGFKLYAKEIAADEHYILSNDKFEFNTEYQGQDIEVIDIRINDGEAIENELKYGSVQGIKVGEADEPLSGALIGIFAPGTKKFTEETAIATVISEEDGSFAFENVPYGEWIVREIVAPTGYVLDNAQHHVYISDDGVIINIRIENEKIYGGLEISKTDVSTGEFLPDVGFKIYDQDKNVITEGVTDENGKFTVEDLVYGDYFYQESSCSNEYVLDDELHPFSIRENKVIIKVEMTNRKKQGNFELTKTDVSTGEALPDVGFKIYDQDENVVAEGVTDKDGKFTVKDLDYGDYFYQEFSCSDEYILDDSLYPFSIREDGVTIKAEMTNRKKQGSFELTKSDVSTGELLPDVGFKIYDKDKNVVAEGVTDKDGKFTVKDLVYGDYFYQEFSCSDEYVLDDSFYPFSIREDGVTVKAEMTNRKKQGSFEIKKVDDTTGDPISGVGFRIYDSEFSIVAEDYTDENGILRFENLAFGDYYYEEFICPDAYVLDDMLYAFSVTEDGAAVTAEVTNRLKQGTLIITKIDPEDSKKVLEGVVFVIEDENGNLINEIATDKNSKAEIELTYGKYVVYEKSTLKGYKLDRTKHEIEITEDGQIVELTIENHKASSESPKTGNPFDCAFWITLFCGFVTLLSGSLFLRKRKTLRKGEDDAVR